MRLEDEEKKKLNEADISSYLPDVEMLRTHATLANLSDGTRNDYVGYCISSGLVCFSCFSSFAC